MMQMYCVQRQVVYACIEKDEIAGKVQESMRKKL